VTVPRPASGAPIAPRSTPGARNGIGAISRSGSRCRCWFPRRRSRVRGLRSSRSSSSQLRACSWTLTFGYCSTNRTAAGRGTTRPDTVRRRRRRGRRRASRDVTASRRARPHSAATSRARSIVQPAEVGRQDARVRAQEQLACRSAARVLNAARQGWLADVQDRRGPHEAAVLCQRDHLAQLLKAPEPCGHAIGMMLKMHWTHSWLRGTLALPKTARVGRPFGNRCSP